MNLAARLRHGLLALSLALVATPALADDDCAVPVERWKPRDAVRTMAAQRGWQVERLKIDDGCYEIRGRDADGRAFKAKVDPETLQVVKFGHRDRDRERNHGRERGREGQTGGSSPRASQGATAPAPLFTPGTAPRGQVE
ncbi:MAG: PepSY domain-containing protein [Burkholderiales bacterium]|jgi:hypothetical protein|nr:PepSY domain-containing protein [Burkholderiales bacterium]